MKHNHIHIIIILNIIMISYQFAISLSLRPQVENSLHDEEEEDAEKTDESKPDGAFLVAVATVSSLSNRKDRTVRVSLG